jgi:hypothetical protein
MGRLAKHRWQFSLRSLLMLTAAISVLTAVASNVPGFVQVTLLIAAPVLLLIAILQTANILTSDRRPILAAISWSLLAGLFALFAASGLRLYYEEQRLNAPTGTFLWFGVMSACSLASAFRAYQSIRRAFHR